MIPYWRMGRALDIGCNNREGCIRQLIMDREIHITALLCVWLCVTLNVYNPSTSSSPTLPPSLLSLSPPPLFLILSISLPFTPHCFTVDLSNGSNRSVTVPRVSSLLITLPNSYGVSFEITVQVVVDYSVLLLHVSLHYVLTWIIWTPEHAPLCVVLLSEYGLSMVGHRCRWWHVRCYTLLLMTTA